MTGFEHATSALMIYRGMVEMGVARIADIRRRYDGIRRNPWDEAECGHHYARAMASWSSFLALTGFRYAGPEKHVIAAPRWPAAKFQSFWSTGTGWGNFELTLDSLTLQVIEGSLPVRTVEFLSPRVVGSPAVKLNDQAVQHHAASKGKNIIVTLASDQTIPAGGKLEVKL
jgi:hypothetical protein